MQYPCIIYTHNVEKLPLFEFEVVKEEWTQISKNQELVCAGKKFVYH